MDFKLPELGEGVYEAELVNWLVKPGDAVKRGQNLMEVLTDKATMEVPSPFAATITELRAEPGRQIKVGDVVLTYSGGGETKPEAETPKRRDAEVEGDGKKKRREEDQAVAISPPRRADVSPTPETVKAAPSVRQMAHRLGIDLTQVRGSGPGGRILIEDLTSQIQSKVGREPAVAREPRPDYGTPGSRIKLQGVRRKIADHMMLAKEKIPPYSYVDECEATELVRLREALKQPFASKGIRLTYLAFFVKAVVAALKDVPIVNASLDEEANEIVLHDRYHIGIAVAAPAGLIVPVIHDADQKDFAAIARDIERLSAEARAGKSKLEDLRGGTFTITSVGNIGGLFSAPIINYPQVAILGVGKIVKRPVFDDKGNVRPADMVYLSFCFDHRVVDGAVGAAFGNAIIKQLQNPAAMLVGG